MSSPMSYTNWCSIVDNDIDIFDAAFKDMHLHVAASSTVVIDSTWEANLPGLAAEKLGDRFLWWALLMYNGIVDPVKEVFPGVVLRIPDPGQLKSYLALRRAQMSGRNYLSPQAVTSL